MHTVLYNDSGDKNRKYKTFETVFYVYSEMQL